MITFAPLFAAVLLGLGVCLPFLIRSERTRRY